MSKLYFNGEFFLELSAYSLYESEFEGILVSNPDLLKPQQWVVPYKKTVYATDGSSAQADLAFIDKRYREWTVVEVEMNRHSLSGHVLPQVRTLKEALYDESDAAYLKNKEPGLDLERLVDLVTLTAPTVAVIVNKPDSEWDLALGNLGVPQIVVEVFRSDRNHHAFRLEGQMDAMPPHIVSYLSADRTLPRLALAASPSALPCLNGNTIELLWNGAIVSFRRMDTGDKCFLQCLGRSPLSVGQAYAIVDRGGARLRIEEV